MAGGKETPRQKMVGMMYLVLTALLALNVSKSILAAFVAIEENIQIANQTEFYRGEEKKDGLKEVAGDKTNPARAKKAAALVKIVDKIDEITAKRIKEIDDLKLEILTVCGEDLNSKGVGHIIVKEYDKKYPLKPIRMNLEHVQSMDKYDEPMHILIGEDIKNPSGKGLDLWNNYNKFRDEICELLATWSTPDGKTNYKFKAPKPINDFKDSKDLSAKIQKAIKDPKNNVSMDDREPLAKIYASLSKNERSEVHGVEGVHWIGKTFDHSPVVAAIASLSSMQKEILAARADAVAVIRLRVGGGEYSFNKIMALAYGPELVNENEEVKIEVLMAAFDSDKQPEVTIKTAGVEEKITEVRDGKGIITKKAGSGGEMVLEGTISITNKSGIKKSRPWSKTIKIMKPTGNVSLPELNVMYRGYPNQITAVASGFDKTDVRGKNVTLSKNKDGWIASPGNGRECEVTVLGKSSLSDQSVALGTFKFRVSALPKPEIFFGTAASGGKIGRAERNLFAKYPPEIPLNAQFTIRNWEIIIPGLPGAPPSGSGSKISAEASTQIKQARPGTKITVTTEYIGPDKVVKRRSGVFVL